MEIRTAALQDLDAVAAVEAACFPAVEAATKEEFAERLRYYGSHFWLMFDGGNLIGFVDGVPGFFMAAGHEGDGVSLAPTTGQMVADLICDGKTDVPAAASFNPNRFDLHAATH